MEMKGQTGQVAGAQAGSTDQGFQVAHRNTTSGLVGSVEGGAGEQPFSSPAFRDGSGGVTKAPTDEGLIKGPEALSNLPQSQTLQRRLLGGGPLNTTHRPEYVCTQHCGQDKVSGVYISGVRESGIGTDQSVSSKSCGKL